MLSNCVTNGQGKAMKILSRAPHVQPETVVFRMLTSLKKKEKTSSPSPKLYGASNAVYLDLLILLPLALPLVFVFVDKFLSRKFRVGRGRHWKIFCDFH